MMEYTKKELAALCGVSVQAIDKKLRKMGLIDGCSMVAGRLQIPATVAATVAIEYGVSIRENEVEVADTQQPVAECQQPNQQPVATSATGSSGSEKAVEALISQLETLQKQLAVKDEQIADLSKALVAAQETARAAQALHAADKAETLAIESQKVSKSRWQRFKDALRGSADEH